MVTVKSENLSGAALNYAVAIAEHVRQKNTYGNVCFDSKTKRVYETQGLRQIGVNFNPASEYKSAGNILDRECIDTVAYGAATVPKNPDYWKATIYDTDGTFVAYGETRLVAAMRCYVLVKLGEIVDIPDELV